MTKTEMEEEYLFKLLQAYKVLYYNGFAIVSDSQYDALEDRLCKINPKNQMLEVVGYRKEWLNANK